MRPLLLAGLFSVLAGGSGPAAAAGLDSLQWQYRVIAVFASTDTEGADAVAALTRASGIDDRDIAWFVVGPRGLRSNIDAAVNRDALIGVHEADGFEAVLIGKDGGVKSRQTKALDINAFFGKIDQMPMRRNEMETR